MTCELVPAMERRTCKEVEIIMDHGCPSDCYCWDLAQRLGTCKSLKFNGYEYVEVELE